MNWFANELLVFESVLRDLEKFCKQNEIWNTETQRKIGLCTTYL